MNPITPYLFGETTIRSLILKSEPWFVIADVCNALELTNPTMVASRMHPDDLSTAEVIDSLGRPQTVNTCNESGLYLLIFQSRKACAKAFTRWVTSEVLPAIRRSGSYNPGHHAYIGLLREQIGLGVSPDIAARCAARLCPTARHADPVATIHSGIEAEIQEILDLMEPGKTYTIPDIAHMLPITHRGCVGSMPARHSTIGKLLNRALRAERVVKLYGRNARYQLPTITPFSASKG